MKSYHCLFGDTRYVRVYKLRRHPMRSANAASEGERGEREMEREREREERERDGNCCFGFVFSALAALLNSREANVRPFFEKLDDGSVQGQKRREREREREREEFDTQRERQGKVVLKSGEILQ